MHNLHFTTAVFFLNPLYLFCHVFSKLNIYKYNTICLHCYISVIYTTGLTKDAIHTLLFKALSIDSVLFVPRFLNLLPKHCHLLAKPRTVVTR